MRLHQFIGGRSSKKMEKNALIPKLIHQTWKDINIPEQYLPFQKSWQTYLPDWEYRLWTDDMNRAFLEKHYDWFLPIYDGYPKPIMQVDSVRYFWMYHFGGLYVDLDFEALKSIEPLILNQKIVIGLEPNDHLEKNFLQKYSFKHILCNAFMASVPKAPFWEYMILQLIKNHKAENPLVATGPFCLTQGYDLFEDKKSITLIPPELLYPINENIGYDHLKNKSNSGISVSNEAYGIHHWSGTWWRDFVKKPGRIDIFAGKLRVNFPKIFKVYDQLLNRPIQ
ncbi:MAG: glycosyltransferase [Chitinophagales bacterium]